MGKNKISVKFSFIENNQLSEQLSKLFENIEKKHYHLFHFTVNMSFLFYNQSLKNIVYFA